jgi:hypothetical protein
LPELALAEGNQQVAMKPSELLSPSLFTFRWRFAAVQHHYYYDFMTARSDRIKHYEWDGPPLLRSH